MTNTIRPEWLHGIDKAVAKLAQYWRRDSGCAADLQEIKTYLEAQIAGRKPYAWHVTVSLADDVMRDELTQDEPNAEHLKKLASIGYESTVTPLFR